MKMLHDNLGVNEKGHLTIAGVDTVVLAKEHGTPLIVFDENKLRENFDFEGTPIKLEFKNKHN